MVNNKLKHTLGAYDLWTDWDSGALNVPHMGIRFSWSSKLKLRCNYVPTFVPNVGARALKIPPS